MPALEFTRVVDEAGLRACQAVIAATYETDHEWLPADPYEDIVPALSGRLNGEPVEYWLGTADGVPVAASVLLYSARDNLDLVNIQIQVHPDHRRCGYGYALVDATLARVRELGRTKVLCEVPLTTRNDDPSPGVGLCAVVGAKQMIVDRRRILRLGTITESTLSRLDDGVGSATDGYSFLRWSDHTPQEWLGDMGGLIALMSTDPPMGDLQLDAETWDADRYDEWEKAIRERRRHRLVVAARHDESGRLAGFTDLATPFGGAVGYQWATIVSSEHRGHRLGMALKIANLRYLKAERPDVEVLNTWNAEDNSYMVSVNDAIGFEEMEQWAEFEVTL